MKGKIFEALNSKEEISVAVLYGSFISSDVFRDVDIGIIVSVEIPYVVDRIQEDFEVVIRQAGVG